jgi:hypothetical protein
LDGKPLAASDPGEDCIGKNYSNKFCVGRAGGEVYVTRLVEMCGTWRLRAQTSEAFTEDCIQNFKSSALG